MAENPDVVMDGKPGADRVTEEEVQPFQVDLNFEVPDAPEPPEEVEFPAQEEAVEEEAEAVVEEEVTDEVDSEDTSEAEVPEEIEGEAADGDEAEGEPEADVEENVLADLEVAEEPEPPKAPMVPKSRLDEVLAKNKKMQKQLDDIQQKEAEAKVEAPQYDFDIKEQEYQQLVLDGALEKATALRSEIRNAEREQLMFSVKQEMGQTVQQDRQSQELQAKATEIAGTFAIFNEDSPDFNEELTREVTELRDAFIIQGYDPADSLARATEYTLAAKHPELLQGEEAVVSAPAKVQQNKAAVAKRQKTTVQKKLAASKSQPPALKGEGTAKRGETVTDINVLSDDEFSALPEETLRRLRGDFG